MPGAEDIQYSDKYYDDIYEYRHVILPAELSKVVPRTHLLSETEWRNLGVQQSVGWVHYMTHPPEPHVLLFRRPKSPPEQGKVVDTSGSEESVNMNEFRDNLVAVMCNNRKL